MFILSILKISATLHVLINSCRWQLQQSCAATNVSILRYFKIGTDTHHRGQIAPNQDTRTSQQCVEANGAGRGRPTMGSGWMRVRLGRGPITYPTGQLFCSGQFIDTCTNFYVGTKMLVKLVFTGYWAVHWVGQWFFGKKDGKPKKAETILSLCLRLSFLSLKNSSISHLCNSSVLMAPPFILFFSVTSLST